MVSGTREWASNSYNVMSGCAHGCAYCYAHAMAARFDRLPAGGWTEEAPSSKAGKPAPKCHGTVMYPTTHDLTPGNAAWTLPALRRLLVAGNQVLVVSKPHLPVVERIVEDLAKYRAQVLFRFTIGSARQITLGYLEPGAPPYNERLACLMLAHRAGWATSVSMEPLLEPDEDRVVDLVELLAPYCTESIWIGKLNRARPTIALNGAWSEKMARTVAVIQASQTNDRCRELVARLGRHPLVRWKESIKAAVGADLATTADEGWSRQPDLLATRAK